MKHLSYAIIPAAVLLTLTGCSFSSPAKHTDEVSAQIEGRRAARTLIHTHWKDSAELRHAYHEILHMRDSIIPQGKTAEFDSTFMSTLRIVEPTLAFSITHGRL